MNQESEVNAALNEPGASAARALNINYTSTEKKGIVRKRKAKKAKKRKI